MNTTPVVPYVLSQQFVKKQGPGTYPDPAHLRKTILEVTPRLFEFDATATAREAGDAKTANLVMTGALFGTGILPESAEEFESWFREEGGPGKVGSNLRAWSAGVALGKNASPVEQEA
jgi:indolepyruvate ferredoxin oxidoreductase beta subunit